MARDDCLLTWYNIGLILPHAMTLPRGESTDPEGLDQDTRAILERFRNARVIRPLRPTRAWGRPPLTSFDPVKAKRAYDAFQRVRAAKDNPPLRDMRVAEFQELLTDFLT